MTLTRFHKAEIFDQPPEKFAHLPGAYDRPYHVLLDDKWHPRGFARRCDASRWARRLADRIVHWYTI